MNINIKLPDGNVKSYPSGITPLEIAKAISPKLAERVVTAEIDGKLYDLNHNIEIDASLVLHTFDTEKGKEVFWHSTSHLMAQAVKELFPDVKVTIGPAIEAGFYYDFDRAESFTDEELLQIENKMLELAKQNLPYTRRELGRNETLALFSGQKEDFKCEILNEIPEGEVLSTYTQGSFTDLCRGPHLTTTSQIKAVKLLKTSGAYWRGDEKNKMLKRIYGISFPSKKELDSYLEKIEEAKKRDHRRLGKDLDLYSVADEVGAGLILWHPNGAMVRHIIETYWKERHIDAGYKLVYTPHIGKSDLWVTSGHLGFYNESMYSPMQIDEQDYIIKPMNCPFHIHIYKSTKRSYKELPIKYAELGTVYRYERSGTLHGLMRVRGFTQDDAHIFCTPEQLLEEVEKIIEFSISMLNAFGFQDFQIYLATKPEKSVGEPSDWDMAIESLKKALAKMNLAYEIDEGGGAFYGPKIDIKIKDALDRSWQCSTIQFDFNMSARFDIEYIGADNQAHRPFMIHRALMGSVERFFGTLIEFYGGNFPLWLAPTQVIVATVSEASAGYAEVVAKHLRQRHFRVECDIRSEKIGYKIRDAEMAKVPYIFVVGEKEASEAKVAVRKHTKGDLGAMNLHEAMAMLLTEIDDFHGKY